MNVGSRVRVTVTRNHRNASHALRGVSEMTGVVTVVRAAEVIIHVTEGPWMNCTFAFPRIYVKEFPA